MNMNCTSLPYGTGSKISGFISHYRFTPVLLSFADVSTIHGNNEKISKLNFRRLADFYLQLMYNCDESIPSELRPGRSEL